MGKEKIIIPHEWRLVRNRKTRQLDFKPVLKSKSNK